MIKILLSQKWQYFVLSEYETNCAASAKGRKRADPGHNAKQSAGEPAYSWGSCLPLHPRQQPDRFPGPLGEEMQAAGLLCCPKSYACLGGGMACPSLVLAMPLDILGGVHRIWPQMLGNLHLSLLSGLSLQGVGRKIYCEEETNFVLEEPVSLRTLTGVCANSIATDTSTVDFSTEPPFELMTPSEHT